ncbi:hypothetical protein PUR61_13670 [Streptomyces sp. BE20]|uniref:hypothetical protein n=1 Tax=Streptomyces sp. BE20 TaxID=3002525 RepID=UPI002E77F85D|nr:hypothetical protein [Streptomyces sp. BE20]MEE1823230.1 hypothetical protein [Streptomyces sp. BE20]
MTVLHSRNADAADAADAKDATDAKDLEQTRGQAVTADTDLREELGRYADLGAFTLTADTHAWYAAVDTVASPEDARAASTVLAELRGHDLQQTWEDVTALAAEVKIDAPDTVGKTAVLVEMLQLVHRTSTILTGAAYDADLGTLVAATADRAWRRERGVKLSWLRARSLRKQAAALAATSGRPRPQDLHEALASAEVERRAWTALAPAGTLPVPPADGALVHRTALAFEAINTGLRDLARLLPGQDLDALSFPDLVDLVDRLAADEGTLYRLPTIRTLRATLEDAGLADLLSELTASRADRRAAEAAYTARQALAGGQRDGLAGSGEPAPTAEAEAADVETAGEADVVETEAPTAAGTDLADTETDGVADIAAEAEAGVDESPVEVEAPASEAPGTDEAEAEPAVETAVESTVEEKPLVVTLPAPSPAADDLVGAAPVEPSAAEVETVTEETPVVEAEAEAEAADADETHAEDRTAEDETETEPVAEPVEEVATEVEAPAAAVVEETAPAVVEAELVAEETPAVEAPVEVVAEKAAAVEVAVVEETAAVEAPAVEASAEPVVEAPAEPVVEAEVVAEETPAVEVVAELVVEAPVEAEKAEAVVVETASVEVVVEAPAEPVADEAAPAVAVDVPVVEAPVEDVAPEPVVEPVVVADVVVDAEPETPVVVEPAAVPAARPAKPAFTPGRPVTAYSAEELLAIVRWIDGDGVGRSDEELLRAAMKELGFARLGPRIKDALGTAVTAARA